MSLQELMGLCLSAIVAKLTLRILARRDILRDEIKIRRHASEGTNHPTATYAVPGNPELVAIAYGLRLTLATVGPGSLFPYEDK